jgi:putative CocE/NonD family hydrolase
VGAIDFGEAAISPIDRLQLRWFDYWLKGIDNGVLGHGESREPSVRLFDLGSKEWRLRDRWPTGDAATTTLYLHTTGLTAMTDGELSPEIPSSIVPQPDTWVHDPWRPVPASGSHASATAGPFERSAIDGRSDVLTYTTASLTEGLSLCGPIQAVLYCRADAASWDLSVVLSQVQPNGQVYNIAQGYQRCHRSMAQPITVTLQPTCLTLAKGQRLRLTISGTCFPAYPVNPGSGDRPELASKMQQRVITLALHSQKEAASKILMATNS